MKHFIYSIILLVSLNCHSQSFSTIDIKNEKEHKHNFNLNKGDEIKFWTKIKYKYENAINIRYVVSIYKNDSLYKHYNYNPTSTKLRYLSSDERWIISKKKNPDYVRYNKKRFTIFGWVENEDERADYQKEKYIFKYGVKKNIKGKNKPVFKVKETGLYTFKIKLKVDTDNNYEIKKAEIILKK